MSLSTDSIQPLLGGFLVFFCVEEVINVRLVDLKHFFYKN